MESSTQIINSPQKKQTTLPLTAHGVVSGGVEEAGRSAQVVVADVVEASPAAVGGEASGGGGGGGRHQCRRLATREQAVGALALGAAADVEAAERGRLLRGGGGRPLRRAAVLV